MGEEAEKRMKIKQMEKREYKKDTNLSINYKIVIKK